MHVHLLAGMDDGPKTADDALAMCRIASEQGVAYSVALAHQNEQYPDNTPDRIREATGRLIQGLKAIGLAYTVFPCAEVMVAPDLLETWDRGELMSVADRRQHLLVEMPHGLCVQLKWMIDGFVDRNITPILGHPERCPELLHDHGEIERLIDAGALVQVSAKSITDPESGADARALKDWFRRGVVHMLGSDGHSRHRRPPHLADAARQVYRWIGPGAAEKIACTNGLEILEGRQIKVTPPEPPRRKWFAFW